MINANSQDIAKKTSNLVNLCDELVVCRLVGSLTHQPDHMIPQQPESDRLISLETLLQFTYIEPEQKVNRDLKCPPGFGI